MDRLVSQQDQSNSEYRNNFSFSVPEPPKSTHGIPDLANFSFGMGDHSGVIDQLPADIARTLMKFCRQSRWDAVDDLIRSFERYISGAMENADIVRTALNLKAEEDGSFPLLILAEKNKINLLERCLSLGAEINQQTENGLTAMHSAALRGNQETILVLLQHGADTSSLGGELQQLPLHLACRREFGALPIVKILLDASESMGRLVEDGKGFTPLWRAVEVSNLPVISLLLEEQTAEQLSKQNPVLDNDTVMHFALKNYTYGIFEVLLESDTDSAFDIQNEEKQTLLHVAVLTDNAKVVDTLRAKGANPNLVDRFERSPIQLAIEKGHQKMTDAFIVAYPESIRLRTKDGSTLCHLAALSGHPETMLVLLNRGVYLHMPNKFGAVALHAAARTGHASVVKALLARGAKVDAKTKDSRTSLHLAVEYGKFHSVETLIGDGASVHIKGGKAGETPLHIAARVPNSDKIAELLIKSGSLLDARMANGETALHAAARAGALRTVELLLKEGSDARMSSETGETALHLAVRSGNYAVAGEILRHLTAKYSKQEAVLMVNMQNTEGETCVHYAAEALVLLPSGGKLDQPVHAPADMIKLLLNYGGEPHTQTKLTYETPMHYAARSGNNAVLKAMFDYFTTAKMQFAMQRRTKIGWPPLLIACDQGLDQTVKLFLQNSARIDVFDEAGRSALHIASENGFVDVVDLLLQYKAFVNSKTRTGFSPLHLAAMRGHADLVTLLVQKYGAAVDILSMSKQTPLHLAAKYKQLQIFQLLLRFGADPMVRDQEGQTPLFLATALDSAEVVRLLITAMGQENPMLLTNAAGLNVAHVAAKTGATEVMDILLALYREEVTKGVVKSTGMTAVHYAAAEGHGEILLKLVNAGASFKDEDKEGMTIVHWAAKNGHLPVLNVLHGLVSWTLTSIKTGLVPIHLAAFWGEVDSVREFLTKVPANIRSAQPTVNTAIVKEIEAEAGLTPLHLACKGGHESVVRLLLNYPAGVELDAAGEVSGFTPLHMTALSGQITIAALLISKSETCMSLLDKKGRTPMILAAGSGKKDLTMFFVSQGVDMNAVDSYGWTALHHASAHGHLSVVQALVEHGANALLVTLDGKTAMNFAAHSGHIEILNYFFSKHLNFDQLSSDPSFALDLMRCAKPLDQAPLETFILGAQSPVEVALKLAFFYRSLAMSDRERALDLTYAAMYCETLANRLLTITCTKHSPSVLFRAIDERGDTLLDMILDGQHKTVASLSDVQKYLMIVWQGGLDLTDLQTTMVLFLFLLFPPSWIAFNLPFHHRFRGIPLLKLLSNFAGNIFFILLLIFVFLSPHERLYERQTMVPNPQEYVLMVWLLGLVLHEATSKEKRTGFARLQIVVIVLCVIGFIIQAAAIPFAKDTQVVMLYIRCQFFATASLFAHIQLLSYMAFHRLFGPLSVMIGEIFRDMTTFLVILGCFLVGFTFAFSALYEEVYRPVGARPDGHFLAIADHSLTNKDLHVPHQATLTVSPRNIGPLGHHVAVPDHTTIHSVDATAHHSQARDKRQIHEQLAGHGPTTVAPAPGAHGGSHPGDHSAGHSELHEGGAAESHTGSHELAHGEAEEKEHFVAPGPGPLLDRRGDPVISLQYITFGIWGLIDPMPDPRGENFRPLHPLPSQDQLPGIGKVWIRVLIGIYLFLVMIVLMKLLVAMLVDTYERIKRSSDFEWRYGRAKLIYGLEITEGTPAPMNLITGTLHGTMWLFRKMTRCCRPAGDSKQLLISKTDLAGNVKPKHSIHNVLSNRGSAGADLVQLIHSVVVWREVVHVYRAQNKSDLKESEDLNEVGNTT